jgi:hypothetical protein
VYGFVKYLDFNDLPRTSQFCYVYTVPKGIISVGINDLALFEVGGPTAYNEYT